MVKGKHRAPQVITFSNFYWSSNKMNGFGFFFFLTGSF